MPELHGASTPDPRPEAGLAAVFPGIEETWTGPELAGDDVAAGLDALDTETTRPRRFDPSAVLAPIGALLVLILIWQSAVWLEVKPIWVLPGPRDVWLSLTRDLGVGAAMAASWTSLSRGVIGFALSLLVGTVLGLVVGQIPLLRKALRPLLAAMQSLPSVAWVPAAILWFQLTNTTMYAVILLGAVPSIAMGLISGLDQTPPLLRRAGLVLGASRWQMVRHVLLPSALPTYVSGMKQGWAFSWRSLMAAEIIVHSPQLGLGLGQLINQGRDLSDVSLVVVAILLVLLVGVLVDVCFFSPLERHILRRRGLLTTH